MGDRRVTISVAIATLRRPERLRSALRSLADLDPAPAQVVVVDGDPERSAVPVADELAAVLPCPVDYVASPAGLTRQRNRALVTVSSDVVLFLDDDARLEPPVLGLLADAYRDATVVGATGRVVEPTSNQVGGQQARVRLLLFGRRGEGRFTRFGYPRRLVRIERAHDVEFMQGCFMSARTDAARQVRFDEALPGYALAEDEDFSLRLSRLGVIRYLPDAVVHHDNAGFGSRDRRAFNRTVVVHRAYLFRKNFAPSLLADVQFAGLLVMLLVHRLLNRDVAGVRGLVDGAVAVLRGARPDQER